jgi:hypothetical protein
MTRISRTCWLVTGLILGAYLGNCNVEQDCAARNTTVVNGSRLVCVVVTPGAEIEQESAP